MRKVYVEVKVRLIIQAEEGVDINDVIQEMDYDFESTTPGAGILEAEILEHEITDSK